MLSSLTCALQTQGNCTRVGPSESVSSISNVDALLAALPKKFAYSSVLQSICPMKWSVAQVQPSTPVNATGVGPPSVPVGNPVPPQIATLLCDADRGAVEYCAGKIPVV